MDDAALAARLEEARRGLLDLSTRNRLLALPQPGRSRGVIRLADEDAGFVFGEMTGGRAFGFEAVAEDAAEAPPRKGRRVARAETAGVAQADTAKTRAQAQGDDLLRAQMPAEELVRRLRDLMTDARAAREETGIATLSLAIGTLSWRDPATPGTERLAPLALLPVTLERAGVSRIFKLRAAGGEVAENLSLREKLAREFRIALPDFDAEAYDPDAWATALRGAIAGQGGWTVDADGLALGLFSFQKFLMWRDLDPATNPGLLTHPMIRALVGGDALAAPAPFPDDADVDAEIPVERLDHVMDVDGSQALAAEAVRRGGANDGHAGHVVIQGPPGTGKSQTIANIIAQAVLDGRRVLFVAEKLAALEVVQRRLAGIGLGAACLELHGDATSKRAVLDALRATLATPAPPKPERDALVQRLGALRGRLNRHARAMAAPVGESGLALHAVVGGLVALRARGVPAPDFSLAAGAWTATGIEAARAAVAELAARAAEGGPASAWRDLSADLAPIEQERLLGRLPGLIRALSAGAVALAPAARVMGLAADAGTAERLLAASRAIAAAPTHDPAAMAHPAWAGDSATLRAPAEAQAALEAAQRDPRLRPGALAVEGLAVARAALAEGGGFFGFLSATQRSAKAVAAQVAAVGAEPLPALDAALAGQAAARVLAAADASPFGSLWGNASAMATLLAWREASGPDAAAALATGMPQVDAAPVDAALAACRTLAAEAGFEGAGLSLADVAGRLGDWAAQPETLPAWLGWRRARDAAGPELAPLARKLAEGVLTPEAARDAFEHALLEALLKAAMRGRPELAAFDGPGFDRLVADFIEADRARIDLARREAAHAHAARLADARSLRGWTLLLGEFEKKRGHLPVRELLLRAGAVVQRAKPVLMMSPLSVAQYLAPPHGLRPGLSFDLLVIDEASQVEPVDALGAIARCRQVVVVGDDKQMPPTRFFQRMTSEEPEEDGAEGSDIVAAREVESILGLANARGVPNVMLRWHYRSRHESLIATSNAEFYGNRLCVLPSPRARSAALGLSLVRVEGRWQEGQGVNPVEAQAVAEAVLRHARETPGDTLGVAAFSIRQRDAILDAVEALRRESPDTEGFFTAHPQEPFFVKNLENVQGDERDSIMISVGYARGPDGRLAMRFGPLSMDGGERRLNVLITRAKKRCIVFSGIGAEDIDLARAAGRGVASLKTFLQAAASGLPDGAPAKATSGGVGDALGGVMAGEIRGAGKEAVLHVGTSGLFLDVAAREGADFILGVEADAGDWAGVTAARDRERGRAAALGQMGWRLHRAWSLAWLQRPDTEAARLRAALGAVPEEAPAPRVATPDPGLALPYVEAAVAVPATPIPDVPFAKLSEILAAIIRAEQPLHADSLMERARLLFGRERLEAPDRAALQQALRLAGQIQGVAEAGGFWTAEDAPPVTPRDRRAVAPHLRRPAMVAPAEVEAAAKTLLAAMPGTTEAELAPGVARLLGLEASAAPAMAARIAALVGAGAIRVQG